MGQAGGLRVRGVHAAFPRQPGQPALLPGAPSTAHPPLAHPAAACNMALCGAQHSMVPHFWAKYQLNSAFL
jgi:hypothetical protein